MSFPDPLEHQLLIRHRIIIGVDEAGRGCLAGPVYAAAVLITTDSYARLASLADLNDSKKLSPRRRDRILDRFLKLDIPWKLGIVSPHIIDQINILQASRLAMKKAVQRLPVTEPYRTLVTVDGNQAIDTRLQQKLVVKGDARFRSIAMASILAKVLRDRFMVAVDRKWPQYGFAGHKGYPAPSHKSALVRYGPSPIHRFSFRGVAD